MTDKEKIRAYIEKLHKEHRGSEGDSIFRRALRTVLFYIDSMQEEPTSVWHDANTLPSDPKAVIVEHNEYSTSICRAEQMSRVKGAKWAYIEDLLKL